MSAGSSNSNGDKEVLRILGQVDHIINYDENVIDLTGEPSESLIPIFLDLLLYKHTDL